MKNASISITTQQIDDMLAGANSLKDFVSKYTKLKHQLESAMANESDEQCYCRLHNRMEPIKNMVLTPKGKSKGVCKAADVIWQRRYREIQKLKRELAWAYKNGNETLYDQLTKSLYVLGRQLNSVSSYDFDRDWKEYLSNK